ncbi:MAG: tetratricopeptide repeat protein [Deltaproteobacteria bacterium]|nr:tetratricopeptide repeat protein [Deltaproteobacteria bacterium]
MRLRSLFCITVIALLLTGCVQVVKDQYHAVKQITVGQYYLDQKKYQKGIEVFRQEVHLHPNNGEAHYYLGRFLLAENHEKEALDYLKRAVELSSKKADYHFWLGVAYGFNKSKDLERESYLSALKLDENHVQALTYLGHNQLERGKYKEALNSYSKALTLWPENPSALYNRALIMKQLGRTPEEKTAWKIYLASYPAGAMARLAVVHLNALGDFSYRNYLIGLRTVTLEKIQFEPFTTKISEDSRPSLDFLGNILKNKNKLSIHIVVYQKKNKELAEARAKSIKKYLLKEFNEIESSRLKVSWFDVPERIKINKTTYQENESINFITAQ